VIIDNHKQVIIDNYVMYIILGMKKLIHLERDFCQQVVYTTSSQMGVSICILAFNFFILQIMKTYLIKFKNIC